MDLNKPSGQWSYSRSQETENIVVFWEAGLGHDPSTATGSYRVNMTGLLEAAEKTVLICIYGLLQTSEAP